MTPQPITPQPQKWHCPVFDTNNVHCLGIFLCPEVQLLINKRLSIYNPVEQLTWLITPGVIETNPCTWPSMLVCYTMDRTSCQMMSTILFPWCPSIHYFQLLKSNLKIIALALWNILRTNNLAYISNLLDPHYQKLLYKNTCLIRNLNC